MREIRIRTRRSAALAACVLLAACATPGGAGAPSAAGTPGLFRTASRMASGMAPGPSAGWYVGEPRFVKMGLARQQARRKPRGWLARMLGAGRAPQAAPAALIAETAGLPVPSVVQIANVRTGAAIRVRIEDRASMGEDLVRLNPAAASALGVAADRPLLVRVRYLAPGIAYREGAGPAYAANRRTRPQTQLAAAAPPAAEAPIVTARLEAPVPAPTPAPAPEAPAPLVLRGPLRATVPELARGGHRIQAGAFAQVANARRAAAMLAPAGPATIEPVTRGGATLYRVFVSTSGAPGSAEATRANVAAIGFPDARIVRGY